MKEFNGIVRVGETADIEKAVEMPFSEVLKLPSFKGEGRGRKPIYNFICFDSERNKKTKYYKKVFIKECMESWKRKFPLSRYIFINVEDCLELSLWTKISFSLISYPTDSLRLYFVSLLDNCFYLDADVYLSKEAKLPTKENDFVYIATGTVTWNKKRNNKNIQELFEYYEKEAININSSSKDRIKKIVVRDDCTMYKRYGNKIKLLDYDSNNYILHLSIVNCANSYLRKEKYYITDSKMGKNENYSKVPTDTFWAFTSYCLNKLYCLNNLIKKQALYESIYLHTNNNRFYVKLENGIPTGISFEKKDGYNISYSNRLFWDWAKHYINNGMYKNIKLEEDFKYFLLCEED